MLPAGKAKGNQDVKKRVTSSKSKFARSIKRNDNKKLDNKRKKSTVAHTTVSVKKVGSSEAKRILTETYLLTVLFFVDLQAKTSTPINSSGSALHHKMMMNYQQAAPSQLLPNSSSGANGGRMRASSFEMLLKAYEFEYQMTNNQSTTSNGSTRAANTAGSIPQGTPHHDAL